MGKLIDETGKRYGYLTVLKRAENIITPNGRSHVAWLCKCDCGNEVIVRGSCLRNGHAKSCGCHTHGNRIINEIGNKYGKLTVIERAGSDSDHKALWRCKCDCGNEIITTGKRLRNGTVRSCGCLKSKGEQLIQQLLTQYKIEYKTQYSPIGWLLSTNYKPYYDFGIFKDNELIALLEYNGEQHRKFYSNKNTYIDII